MLAVLVAHNLAQVGALLPPLAALAPSMSLAEIRAALGTLPTSFHLAPFPTTMPNTVVSPATGAFATSFHSTAFSTPVSHTVERASVHTFGANATPIKGAAFSTSVAFAQRRAALRPLVTILDDAALASSMGFAKHRAPLGSFCTPRKLAPAHSITTTDFNITLSTRHQSGYRGY